MDKDEIARIAEAISEKEHNCSFEELNEDKKHEVWGKAEIEYLERIQEGADNLRDEMLLRGDRGEFGLVNLVVHKSKNEVKIWACNPKTGQNVFRLKAMGKVHAATIKDIIVRASVFTKEELQQIESTFDTSLSVEEDEEMAEMMKSILEKCKLRG